MKNKKEQKFIMLPTVDICFQNLMENAKVRQGFVAAILKIDPKQIEKTELLPTHLSRESPDDKLGILDFIRYPNDDRCYRSNHLRDDETGELYSDKLELQVLELKKLPKEVKTGDDIIAWMKFFSGKTREEFENMAGTNEYIDEAYNTLLKLSSDDKKRLEYEAREKAIRDYNSQMHSAERSGMEKGIAIGEERGEKRGIAIGEERGEKRGIAIGEERAEERTKRIFKLSAQGKSAEEIAEECGVTVEKILDILN